MWLFQASQRLRKRCRDEKGAPIESAGVVGAGIMGGGIAWALSNAGLPVRMRDIQWPAVAGGPVEESSDRHAVTTCHQSEQRLIQRVRRRWRPSERS